MIARFPVFNRAGPPAVTPPPPAGDTLIALAYTSLNAIDPGRLNFYVDYSELSAVGTHAVYVRRTHGTQGAASVDVVSGGDSHTFTTTTLNWADGEADIKTIQATVSSKSDGTHRMYFQLTNPSGAVLHYGAQTKAYCVIDDGTVSTDAVFCNMTLGSGGTGTSGDPYGSIYTAITDVNGGERYLYLTGTHTPDGTNTGSPYSGTQKCINYPSTRASETARIYVEQWPGQTRPVIDGNGDTDTFGFLDATGATSYITFRNIDFTDLSTITQAGQPCGAIWSHYGSHAGLTFEYITVDGIDGEENQGGINVYGGVGAKVWRCTFTNITRAGSATNNNNAGVFSYTGDSISVQRCEFASNLANGTYHKQALNGTVSMGCQFNIFDNCPAHWGQQGTSSDTHFGVLCTNNLFKGVDGLIEPITTNQALRGSNEISNNYCYQTGESLKGAIRQTNLDGMIVHSNIFDTCRLAFNDEFLNFTGDDPIFMDWNTVFAPTFNAYSINETNYSTSAVLNAAIPLYAGNDTNTNPLPVNAATNDFTLQGGSGAIDTGLDAEGDSGIYLTGIEVIGA